MSFGVLIAYNFEEKSGRDMSKKKKETKMSSDKGTV